MLFQFSMILGHIVLYYLNHFQNVILLQVGRSLYLLGRHKAALDIYAEAAKLAPEDPELLHNQGVCLVYLNDYTKAEE